MWLLRAKRTDKVDRIDAAPDPNTDTQTDTDLHGQTPTSTDDPQTRSPAGPNLQPDDAGANTDGRWRTGRHTGTRATKATKVTLAPVLPVLPFRLTLVQSATGKPGATQ